jgi:precorrin-2 dehydrogenase / sirohydrochlorin ferrochelatase
MNSYYPLVFDIESKKCVVIGGGQVALRKVKSLLEHGADVTVISPRFCAGLRELAEKGKIIPLRRAYRPGDLENACIAIAASSSTKVNAKAAQEAKEGRVPVNVVDVPRLSDFIVPSSMTRGDLTIAVSTGGNSPALARKIRIKLEKEFGQEYAVLALLAGEIRSELGRKGIKSGGKRWQEALDLDILLDLIKHGKREKARAFLLKQLQSEKPE